MQGNLHRAVRPPSGGLYVGSLVTIRNLISMVMTLSAIVALLQSAILLLSATQTTPNLPTSFRSNAIVVAQQAISEATFMLMSSSTPASSIEASSSTQPKSQNPSATQTTAATSTPVGFTVNGQPVYFGTGYYLISPSTGCLMGIVGTKNGQGLFTAQGGIPTSCPK